MRGRIFLHEIIFIEEFLFGHHCHFLDGLEDLDGRNHFLDADLGIDFLGLLVNPGQLLFRHFCLVDPVDTDVRVQHDLEDDIAVRHFFQLFIDGRLIGKEVYQRQTYLVHELFSRERTQGVNIELLQRRHLLVAGHRIIDRAFHQITVQEVVVVGQDAVAFIIELGLGLVDHNICFGHFVSLFQDRFGLHIIIIYYYNFF